MKIWHIGNNISVKIQLMAWSKALKLMETTLSRDFYGNKNSEIFK